ncbi:MAG: hypothetical protein PUD51_03245 [Prevotellaceae bacterium]|nr:hypothetical protein [Prevotellaceae bacterium]
MKKEYIKPEIQVFEIGHQQLLADSGSEIIDFNMINEKPYDVNDNML